MTQHSWIQIIALLACLILPASALAAHRLQWRDGLRLALIWAGIFTAVALLFSLVMGR